MGMAMGPWGPLEGPLEPLGGSLGPFGLSGGFLGDPLEDSWLPEAFHFGSKSSY